MKSLIFDTMREPEDVQLRSEDTCRIDKKNTRIINGRVRIILNNIPENTEMIYYHAGQFDEKTPGKDIIGAANALSVKAYREEGRIEAACAADFEKIMITVILQWKKGNRRGYYSPKRITIDNPETKKIIRYDLFWPERPDKKSKMLEILKKPSSHPPRAILKISTDGESFPRLFLCARKDGNMPLTLNQGTVLREIPAAKAKKSLNIELDENTFKGLVPGSMLGLLLDPSEENYSCPICEEISHLKY